MYISSPIFLFSAKSFFLSDSMKFFVFFLNNSILKISSQIQNDLKNNQIIVELTIIMLITTERIDISI